MENWLEISLTVALALLVLILSSRLTMMGTLGRGPGILDHLGDLVSKVLAGRVGGMDGRLARRSKTGRGWNRAHKLDRSPSAKPSEAPATRSKLDPLQAVLAWRGRRAGDDGRVRRVFFATTREVREGPVFTGERADGVTYGQIGVRIPEKHSFGRIELPRVLRVFSFEIYRQQAEPGLHFTTRSVTCQSLEEWLGDVRGAGKAEALVFVHGFNNTFEEAAYRFAQIVYDLQYDGLPVLFSWASRGGVLNYLYDRESAAVARRAFIDLLRTIQRDAGIRRVHVLAHSMGNFCVLDSLASHANTADPVRIAELIMAAPDVDQSHFKQIVGDVRTVVSGMTLYASSADKALIASRRIAGDMPRAGDVYGGGPLVVPGVESIDATAMGQDLLSLNHGIFASKRSLLNDIKILLQSGQRPPDMRLADLRCVPEKPDAVRYWRYVP